MQTIANRYRILGTLGEGAMGTVHRVADTLAAGPELALKVMRVPERITPELSLRFKDEFRAMTRLQHPNTLAVHDFGQLDEHAHFLVMELVPGRELAELIADGPLAPAVAYPLLIQLLQALDFIHARLFVHRDIKAENLRVRADGTLKLLDFGLMEQLGTTANGKLVGTPATMPPEAIRGGVIGAGADLYSVGCLAFQLITGRLPFEGTLREVLRAHVQELPPGPRALNPACPERLEALILKLLEKDPARRYQQATDVLADLEPLAGVQIARPSLEQRRSYLSAGALVGREAELASLEAALAARGGAVFVSAPAGVGKSRLVQEAALQAKLEGYAVVTLRCLESGMAPHELPDQLRRELRPFLAPDGEELPTKDAMLAWVATVAARHPLLLVVEDLHWADAFGLEVLAHLVRHAAERRFLVVGTFRSDEVPAGSRLADLLEEGTAQALALAPFGLEQMDALLDAMFRRPRLSEAFRAGLHGATAGNAFFLTEVLRYLLEQGLLSRQDGSWTFPADPEVLTTLASVQGVVARRLGSLSAQALGIARAAAVIGQDLRLEALAAVSEASEDALFAALQELVERQFLQREDHRYRFPHDRVREALYEDLPPACRVDYHLRYARYLEASDANLTAQLAHHFFHAGDAERGFRYQRLAGDQAMREGVPAAALEHWRLAERARPDGDLLELWWSIGSVGYEIAPLVAAEALEKLMAAPLGEEWRPRRAQALAFLASAYGFGGRPNRSLAVAELARAELPPGETPLNAALESVGCAGLLAAGRVRELAVAARETARVLVGRDLSEEPRLVRLTRVGSQSYQNGVCYMGVRPDDDLRDQALAAAVRAEALNLYNVVRHYHAIWHAWTGRRREALAYVEATTDHCRRIGSPPYGAVLYLRPYMLAQIGEWQEASAWIERALAHPHFANQDFFRQLTRVLAAQVQAALGDPASAAAALREVQAHAHTHGLLLVALRATLALAELGDPASAQAALAAARALDNPMHEAIALRLVGSERARANDPAGAEASFAQAIAILARPEQDNPLEQAHVHVARAEAALARRDGSSALDALERAGDRYERLGNRFQLARVLALMAEAGRVEATAVRPPEGLPRWARGPAPLANW
ncbi:MAG: hypothetical protein JWM80_6659 [Cyanobacteria bacterium RYN_339]|nr:hypothetical protein [Cyanobacteria bacterium RYN_339]